MVFAPLLLYAIVKTFFFSPFLVQGDSMLPTLQNGQIFLVDRLTYRAEDPQRDDVVVFSLDEDPGYFYVKRVIGLPFDTMHLEKTGVDLMNPSTGTPHRLAEPFVMPTAGHPSEPFSLKTASSPRSEKFLSDSNELGQDFKVPAGKYFVLGDNRGHSKDSRFFKDPFVPRDHIVGKLIFYPPVVHQYQELPMKPLGVLTPTGEQGFNVQVADTENERRTGLMMRKSMRPGEGMVFLFDAEQPLSFWMKNTLMPLDIIFIDKDWKVVSIQKGAQPCKADPCPLYPSGGPAKYVLEINAGLSDKLNIAPGSIVQF